MGSEKKKKDRKKDKKKKSRHSDSPERREKKRHKRDSPSDNADNFEQASLSVQDTNKLREKLGLKPLQVEPKKEEKEEDKNVISLSIDETNKLREKLGLRPLDVESKSGDVHVPAKNMRKILETEKLADKMKMLKEKRRIKQQLNSVKSLGAGSTDLTETLAWVQKSRTIDSKKAAAEARTKILDSMDDEFGIDELVEKERMGKAQYSGNDLKDLTVLHDLNSFKEGQMTVLTLQDKGVLDDDDDGDVLVNVNMIDEERANKNNELKKKKPDYNPYTDDIDEFGNIKRQNMLSKYDEVIEGEKKKSFKLSETESSELIRKKMAEGLQKRQGNITLDTSHLKVTATEYYTTDEVAAFKKPRRKKLRKIRKTKVDEIAPLPNEDKLTGSKDHGSRSSKSNRSTGREETERRHDNDDNMEIDIDEGVSTTATKKGTGGKISEKELYSVQLDDEDNELEAALARSRRTKLLEDRKSVLDNLVRRETDEETIPGVAKASAIVLDRTAEFAKGIGSNEEDKTNVVPPKPEPMETQEGPQTISDWKDVDFVTATFGEFQDYDPSRVETQEVIEAEPSLQRGLSGALQVAQRKGFIDTTKQSINSKDINDAVKATGSLRARFYQVDKDTGQDVDSRRRGDREYSSGVFPEKRNYNPDVKIAYTDSIGRELNSKEAFRQLSHKFHGKGSGKMKTEKRMKKAIEEMSLKKMDSDDTPLGSAALFREKQKDANSAYIVLSGGNRIPTDVNNSISKLSKR